MSDVTTMLAGIKARAEKATEGPWRTWKDGEERRDAAVETAWAHDEAGEDTELITDWCSPEDARFIAAARTDVPRLVSALEAVAGLHRSRQFDPLKDGVWFGQSDFDYAVCDHCVMTRYPCPTVTAVVAALGGGE